LARGRKSGEHGSDGRALSDAKIVVYAQAYY